MSERTSYVHGTPSWVDLGSPDLDQSKAFYAEIFGWTALTAPQPEAGGYTMFQLRGHDVAGMGPLQEGHPPAWTSYVSVDDADKVAELAGGAGGSVLMEPVDVLDVGRMGMLADPTGATIAIWQPRAHAGAGLVNEPGAFCWNELLTADPAAALDFYGQVFGWVGEASGDYTELRVDGRGIAGMMAKPAELTDVPSHWLVYFSVADCDATATRIPAVGGQVVKDPDDVPGVGRFAVAQDPHGATFAVIALTNPQ